MKLHRILFVAMMIFAGTGICSAQDGSSETAKQDDPLAGVKCIVAGDNAASADYAVDYMEGKVYFCCEKCKKTFVDDHEDFLVKANHQLVITGQYVQKGCPITGMEVKEGMTVSVGGAEVGLCCGRCKSSVEGAVDLEAKAELVFSHDAFVKGYEKAIILDGITCPVGGGEVSKEFSADYMGATVYFCCEKCAGTFAKDSEEYASLANYQLAATGQYVQENCPFSGMPCKEDIHCEVAKVNVGFCCKGCASKVADKQETEDQINLVFASETFKKAFVAKGKPKN